MESTTACFSTQVSPRFWNTPLSMRWAKPLLPALSESPCARLEIRTAAPVTRGGFTGGVGLSMELGFHELVKARSAFGSRTCIRTPPKCSRFCVAEPNASTSACLDAGGSCIRALAMRDTCLAYIR